MQTWVLVCAGGAIGALARFGLTEYVDRRIPGALPAGTLVVNVVGCFLLGVLVSLMLERDDIDPRMRYFLGAGLLGAFTTFSTFGAETIELLRQDRMPVALANVALNVVAGLLAVWIGHSLVKLVLD